MTIALRDEPLADAAGNNSTVCDSDEGYCKMQIDDCKLQICAGRASGQEGRVQIRNPQFASCSLQFAIFLLRNVRLTLVVAAVVFVLPGHSPSFAQAPIEAPPAGPTADAVPAPGSVPAAPGGTPVV